MSGLEKLRNKKCPWCGGVMKWYSKEDMWLCTECGTRRSEFLI